MHVNDIRVVHFPWHCYMCIFCIVWQLFHRHRYIDGKFLLCERGIFTTYYFAAEKIPTVFRVA